VLYTPVLCCNAMQRRVPGVVSARLLDTTAVRSPGRLSEHIINRDKIAARMRVWTATDSDMAYEAAHEKRTKDTTTFLSR
jgi:hypothetical protein